MSKLTIEALRAELDARGGLLVAGGAVWGEDESACPVCAVELAYVVMRGEVCDEGEDIGLPHGLISLNDRYRSDAIRTRDMLPLLEVLGRPEARTSEYLDRVKAGFNQIVEDPTAARKIHESTRVGDALRWMLVDLIGRDSDDEALTKIVEAMVEA